MRAVKIAVVACSLFAAAAAWAQSEAPAGTVPQQVFQAAALRTARTSARHHDMKPSGLGECIGPVSFCNIYFGS